MNNSSTSQKIRKIRAEDKQKNDVTKSDLRKNIRLAKRTELIKTGKKQITIKTARIPRQRRRNQK